MRTLSSFPREYYNIIMKGVELHSKSELEVFGSFYCINAESDLIPLTLDDADFNKSLDLLISNQFLVEMNGGNLGLLILNVEPKSLARYLKLLDQYHDLNQTVGVKLVNTSVLDPLVYLIDYSVNLCLVMKVNLSPLKISEGFVFEFFI